MSVSQASCSSSGKYVTHNLLLIHMLWVSGSHCIISMECCAWIFTSVSQLVLDIAGFGEKGLKSSIGSRKMWGGGGMCVWSYVDQGVALNKIFLRRIENRS